MKLCLLCNASNATKKNSHILPYFLIKEAINKEGEKLRDYEITFSIYDTFVSSYFGRNIQPEKIEEVSGASVKPDDLSRNNPFSQDYIFCPNCEDKFGKLEGLFEKEIYSKLNDAEIDMVLDKERSKLLTLFAYSIYWRASVVSFNGFKLSYKAEKNLRNLLNQTLDVDAKILRSNISGIEKERLLYFVVTSFFVTPKDIEQSGNVIKLAISKIPYFLVLNKTCFQLFEKSIHVYSSQEYRYGLNRMFDIPKYYEAYQKGSSIIAVISNENRREFLSKIFNDVIADSTSSVARVFSQGFKMIFGVNPSSMIKAQLFYLMNKNAISKFTVFSQENIQASCAELIIGIAAQNGFRIKS